MAGAASSFTSRLLISSLFLASWFCAAEAQSTIPVVNGLSWTFYKSNCPKLESIVRKQLQKVFKKDIEQAAGLLRLHFHDCFVQVSRYFIYFKLILASAILFSCDMLLFFSNSKDLNCRDVMVQCCLMDQRVGRVSRTRLPT